MSKRRQTILNNLPIILLLIINLIIGFFVVKNYGESWDEPIIYPYGSRTIQVYADFIQTGKISIFQDEPLTSYGPVYYVAGDGLSRLFSKIHSAWTNIDSWHYINFITFQIGILSLYFLAKKWLKNWAAFGTALLFSTQPLLWGHSFINPKDIGFMSFFLASVAVGLYMVDRVIRSSKTPTGQKTANSGGKGEQTDKREDPGTLKSKKGTRVLWKGFSSFVSDSFHLLLNPMVLGAGLLLGFTTSIRVLGPLAGGIVVLYAFGKSRRKAFLLLVPYFLVAGLITYLTWPYLWQNPVPRYIKSFFDMSHFVNGFQILFRGKMYSILNLPKDYLPFLMAVQFTEVVLPLFILGIFASIWRVWKDKNIEPFFLIMVWFVIPLTAVIFSGAIFFDNFRHLIFLVPPIFFACGLAMEALFSRIQKGVLRGLILLVLVLPGLYANVQLHPYQYVYYNSFVGGVRGAYHNYDLDYWGVTFAEAAKYMNTVAPENASILVDGPSMVFQDYARPDLQILDTITMEPGTHFDYVVLYSRGEDDLSVCPTGKTIKTIQRGGAVLLTVKIPPVSGQGCP